MSGMTTLKLISYLVKDYPVELFEVYRDYLEEVLNIEGLLIIDSRWDGPPGPPRSDVFASGQADIGFMCSSAFLKLKGDNKSSVELLPVGAVHNHPKGQNRPIYFADVIIHSSKKNTYTEFEKLKGHTWAYNRPNSISGNYAALEALRKLGTNASFFGHKLETGSHIKSIDMVLNGKADAAAVNSVCLDHYRRTRPAVKEQIHVLKSWGPLSIYAVVVNSKMSDDLKQKIIAAFLDMNKEEKWRTRLEELGVSGFQSIDDSLHDFERQMLNNSKSETINTVYY